MACSTVFTLTEYGIGKLKHIEKISSDCATQYDDRTFHVGYSLRVKGKLQRNRNLNSVIVL